MATPFIDVLTTDQQELVARRAKSVRPSYYSAQIEAVQLSAGPPPPDSGKIRISQDLEAVLILLPAAAKKGVLSFINTALAAVSSLDEDDFALFSEVLEIRDNNYIQVHTDSGKKVAEYDTARSQVLSFVESRARQKMLSNSADGAAVSSAAATSVVIPDLSILFTSLASSYDSVSRPDDLALHDRVADSGFVYAIQDTATSRARELDSWAEVIRKYLVL